MSDAKTLGGQSCKYFRTPLTHETCLAGVRFDDVRQPNRMLPCLPRRSAETSRVSQADCAKREEPTAEELAAEDQAFTAAYGRLAKALEVIDKLLKEAAASEIFAISGAIPCPVCQAGTMSYSAARNPKSGSNRHRNFFQVKCSTTGCVEGRGH